MKRYRKYLENLDLENVDFVQTSLGMYTLKFPEYPIRLLRIHPEEIRDKISDILQSQLEEHFDIFFLGYKTHLTYAIVCEKEKTQFIINIKQYDNDDLFVEVSKMMGAPYSVFSAQFSNKIQSSIKILLNQIIWDAKKNMSGIIRNKLASMEKESILLGPAENLIGEYLGIKKIRGGKVRRSKRRSVKRRSIKRKSLMRK